MVFYADDLRATALKLHNPDGVEAPNLAGLAERGVVYDRVFTPHPLCLPARASLFTGQYSWTHGSRHNQAVLTPGKPTLAAQLREAGYRTGLFGKNHCFVPEDLARNFDLEGTIGSEVWRRSIDADLARERRRHGEWLKEQGGALLAPVASPFSHEIYTTHLATERALEFLDSEDERPFFAFVSLTEPHTPNEAPADFGANVAPARLPQYDPGDIASKNTRMQIYDYLIRGSEIPDDYLRKCLEIYHAKTLFLDAELGRVLDALERKGLTDDTIVLFTSDNGDFATEHHLIAKTGSLVDAIVHMPLILSYPGRLPEGERNSSLVNQVDIMPTLLTLCGVDCPDAVEGRPMPLSAEDPGRSYVYSEYGAGGPEYTWEDARALGPAERLGDYALQTPEELDHLARREKAGHLRMIRTETHKVTVDSNGEIELFDLERDPAELANFHGDPGYATIERELLEKLDEA